MKTPDHPSPQRLARKIGLYIHIPFCRRRCRYCHFTTLRHRPETISEYISLVSRELSLFSQPEVTIRTVYLGGGSPSLLTIEQLREIMRAIRSRFPAFKPVEVSIEVNPEDLAPEWLRGAVEAGFTRISIGVQSLNTEVLRILGRRHGAETACRGISMAVEAGFRDINVDLMIGIKERPPAEIQGEIRRLAGHAVTHMSIYMLELSPEDTRSTEANAANEYESAVKAAAEAGFARYEVSSFARPGHECRHNLTYWRNQEYLGIGLSAAGYLDAVDYRNTRRMSRYRRGILSGRPVRMRRRISGEQRKLITGLRLSEGVPISTASSRMKSLGPLLEAGILREARGRLAVSPDHMLMLNEILGRYVL